MTRPEALEVILKHRPTLKRTLDRIMKWDESLGMKALSVKLGIGLTSIDQMSKEYGLKYIRRKPE